MIPIPNECNNVIFVIKPTDYCLSINSEIVTAEKKVVRLPDVSIFVESGYLTVSCFELPLNLSIGFDKNVEICHIDFKIAGRQPKLLDSTHGGFASTIDFNGTNLSLVDNNNNEVIISNNCIPDTESIKAEMQQIIDAKENEIETLKAKIEILSEISPLKEDADSISSQFENVESDYIIENRISDGLLESIKAISSLRKKTKKNVNKLNDVMDLYMIYRENVYREISKAHVSTGKVNNESISEEVFTSKLEHLLRNDDEQ